jgi:hypothetical protein
VELIDDVLLIRNPMESLSLVVSHYDYKKKTKVKSNVLCNDFCILVSLGICAQKKVAGRCEGLFRRFYYDVTTKKCEQFIYGGCRGNENNFKSKDECETICINSFNHFFI